MMPSHKPGFERVAPVYRILEKLTHGSLQDAARTAHLLALCKQLENHPSAPRILLLGEGPGTFLSRLLSSLPKARVTVVEISPRMLKLARSRLSEQAASRVEWVCGDALKWEPAAPDAPFELVATHFFFDLLTPPEQAALIHRTAPWLAPSGWWLYTDYCQPSQLQKGSERLRQALVLGGLYRFFAVTCTFSARQLHSPEPLFLENRFEPIARQQFCRNLIESVLLQH